MQKCSRRSFLKRAGGAVALPWLVPASVRAAAAVPLNVKSFVTSYRSLSAVAVYPLTLCSSPS